MPEASDPPDRPLRPALPPRPAPGFALPAARDEEDPWEISAPPGFFQRWRRGWRLGLVLALLVLGYGLWRGGRDYAHLKAWRARGLAGEAAAESARGAPGKAAALLDQAAILAPLDPVVMRTMADFCEPRQDIMAIYALRQVVKSGGASPADFERLCRLALDWGHPELAATQTLKQWSDAPAEGLSATQLRLSAAWLSSLGQFKEGEQRLRQALALSAGTPESLVLEVALSRLLMNAASSAGMAEEAAAEPLQRLSSVAYSPSAPLPVRAEATRLLAGLLLHPARRNLLTPVRADLLQSGFAELAAATASTDPAGAMAYELAGVTVNLAASPGRREEWIRPILEKATTAPVPVRLAIARWFNENGFAAEALSLCDTTSGVAADPDWFTVRVDALFAQRAFDPAIKLLSDPGQPLPGHRQQLFLYRIDRAAGRDESALAARRADLEKRVARAEPREVLETAENLERSGDIPTALALYSGLKNHPHAGLTARLGMVRCLDAFPDRTSDLIKALEGVLQLWPQSDQARNDLAYLRLLEGKPVADDCEAVAGFQRQFPGFLSFRISAALGALHQQKPVEALALLESDPVPWDRVRPGWQAVYAAVLAANDRPEEAKAIATRLAGAPLRPSEQKRLGIPAE